MLFRPRRLPLFPLATVLFPGGRLPLKIFEQRYLDLVKQCLADNGTFGLCGIREGQEVGEPAVPFAVGTEVRIVEWDMPQTGMFEIVVEGLDRYVARSWSPDDKGLLVGEVEAVSREQPCAVPEALRLCAEVLRHATLAHLPPVSEPQYEDAVWVGYRLSEMLPFKLSVKQDLLEMNDSVTRLRLLDQFLRKQAK
jgi:Lon protease-like protein